MSEPKDISEVPVQPGSNNVFADLGFPNPDEELLKVDLVREIIRAMQQRRLTPAQAAEVLGVLLSTVADLVHGRFEMFPIDRLLRFLGDLGVDIEIVLTPSARGHGQTRVSAAS
jgi:predicted XRE-type DNA-binding protein